MHKLTLFRFVRYDSQASDTEKIWRRYSLGHDSGDQDHFATRAFHRSPSYPNDARPGVTAFVNSMHDILDRPRRNSVHFSED